MDGFDLSSYVNTSVTNALKSVSNPVFQEAMSIYYGNIDKDRFFAPSRILKSGNRTIVFWPDGTKTIVKRAEDEPDNDYAAFTAALGIKIFGSNSALRRTIKKSVKVQEKKERGKM